MTNGLWTLKIGIWILGRLIMLAIDGNIKA